MSYFCNSCANMGMSPMGLNMAGMGGQMMGGMGGPMMGGMGGPMMGGGGTGTGVNGSAQYNNPYYPSASANGGMGQTAPDGLPSCCTWDFLEPYCKPLDGTEDLSGIVMDPEVITKFPDVKMISHERKEKDNDNNENVEIIQCKEKEKEKMREAKETEEKEKRSKSKKRKHKTEKMFTPFDENKEDSKLSKDRYKVPEMADENAFLNTPIQTCGCCKKIVADGAGIKELKKGTLTKQQKDIISNYLKSQTNDNERCATQGSESSYHNQACETVNIIKRSLDQSTKNEKNEQIKEKEKTCMCDFCRLHKVKFNCPPNTQGDFESKDSKKSLLVTEKITRKDEREVNNSGEKVLHAEGSRTGMCYCPRCCIEYAALSIQLKRQQDNHLQNGIYDPITLPPEEKVKKIINPIQKPKEQAKNISKFVKPTDCCVICKALNESATK